MKRIMEESRELLAEWGKRRYEDAILNFILIEGASSEIRVRYHAASEKHWETLQRMRNAAKPVGGGLEYEKWMLEALRVSDEEWAKESAECFRLARETA